MIELSFSGTTIIEHNGNRFAVELQHDDGAPAPWEAEDGHGPVTDWERRSKRPGELVLSEDRGFKRFYDYAEACRIARRDGWGATPLKIEMPVMEGVVFGSSDLVLSETPRELAARAALEDFKRLRAWCRDDWSYVGVIVRFVDIDDETIQDPVESLWQIESDSPEYLYEVACELAEQLQHNAASLKTA